MGGPKHVAESWTQTGGLGTLGQCELGGKKRRVRLDKHGWKVWALRTRLDKWCGSKHSDAANGRVWSTAPVTSEQAQTTLDTWPTSVENYQFSHEDVELRQCEPRST